MKFVIMFVVGIDECMMVVVVVCFGLFGMIVSYCWMCMVVLMVWL